MPVVTKGKSKNRKVDDLDLYYDGCKTGFSIVLARHGANTICLFPEERHGSLDGDKLKKMGITADKVKSTVGLPDALFFRQLLSSMCDTNKSGVEEDERINFYDDVQIFFALYQISIKICAEYGHELPLLSVDEFVKFDGLVIRDTMHGRGEGTIYRRCHNGATGDALIKKGITATRWHEIKRDFKLYKNDTAPKRGENKYNSAYKFDLIHKVIPSNVNNITKHAFLDLAGVETTWGHARYCEAGSGITGWIMNKPGISMGDQVVSISDANRI